MSEIPQLSADKDRLALAKRDHEVRLIEIRNSIRGRRLSPDVYRELCAEQSRITSAIREIENKLIPIKHRLRAIADEERDAANKRLAEKVTVNDHADPEIVRSLVELREYYQQFSADATRVSSMRQMASEFVVKLNPIIKRAVSKK